MERDSRGRLPGSSDSKKFKWGRKKKRPRIFWGREKNEAGTNGTLNAAERTSGSPASSTPTLTPLRVPTTSRSSIKPDLTRTACTTSSWLETPIIAPAQTASTSIKTENSSPGNLSSWPCNLTKFDVSLPSTSTGRQESTAQRPVDSRYTSKPSKIPVATSRSALKLKQIPVEPSNVKNRIIDISILFPKLEEVLVCRACQGNILFSETGTRGLGFKICLTCSKCHKVSFIDSSKQLGKKSNAYDINKRSLLATRALGQGWNSLNTFCGVMDLPKPVARSYFDLINDQLKTASKEVAQDSMKAAVQEELDIETSESSEITVSGDGSWRKRGHTSLQGISSLIRHDNGKVIDIAIKHSFCRACAEHENDDKNSQEYQEWYTKHEPSCAANHHGSSGRMEVDGIVEMFKRSEEIHGVKYQNYIGDGDSKVYKAICDAKPYGDNYIIKKKECVGHVQKRMGTRLRNLKSSFSGKNYRMGRRLEEEVA